MYKYLLVFFISSMCFSQTSFENAETFIAKKEFVKAEAEMSIFLEDNPNDLKAIELLGDAYGHQKKWDDAIGQYQVLKQKRPNNANYHYKYGGALGMKALSISKIRALGIIGDVKMRFIKRRS